MLTLTQDSYAFPSELLGEDVQTVLLLFGAGLGGRNDGWWVSEAGKTKVTVVDRDEKALVGMASMYPISWRWVNTDSFAFAKTAAARRVRWDIVSADLPASQVSRMVDSLPLWMSIADSCLVSTVMRHNFVGEPSIDQLPEPPRDWRYVELIHRTHLHGGVWWLVSERLS